MQALHFHIPAVVLFALVGVSVGHAEVDELAADPIARADLLLRQFPLPTGEAAPLRQDVRGVLHGRRPALRDTGWIRYVKKFFCHADVPSMERAENLLLIARWQRDADLNIAALATLREALDAAEDAYTSQDAPASGYGVNWAERIAHRLIEWNGREDEILRAVDLATSVRMHDPLGVDPRYSKTAAESTRHELVVRLVERETTPLKRARAWADAAIGYRESDDGRRSVEAAERCVAELDRIPDAEMRVRRMSQDWRLEVVYILWDAGERAGAEKALEHAEKGNYLAQSELGLATARLRIGLDEEAHKRIDLYYAKIAERTLTLKEEAWMRESGWIGIATTYAERGDLEEAEKTLAKIPARSQRRMRGVRYVGKQLLDRGDPKSKAAARDFFARNAQFAAFAEKIPDDEQLGWLEETVYCAATAASAGAIEAVELQFLPTMTAKEQKSVIRSLAANSTELALDERVRRYVTPQPDPTERAQLLAAIADRLEEDETLVRVEGMILEEQECEPTKMAWLLATLAERRQSLHHWDRARELFELALARTSEIEREDRQAGCTSGLIAVLLLHGHADLARQAAEQLIDLAWQTRARPVDRWRPGNRARCVLAAKELLEATNGPGRETTVEPER